MDKIRKNEVLNKRFISPLIPERYISKFDIEELKLKKSKTPILINKSPNHVKEKNLDLLNFYDSKDYTDVEINQYINKTSISSQIEDNLD